jgi:hypothetical protein
MRRTVLVLALALALAALPVATPMAQATAADGGRISDPEPVPAPPFDYAPGEVCPFGVHVEFPVNEQLQRTVTDAQGRPRFATVTGALVARATNIETGETVERDLDQDGRAFIFYREDGGQRLIAFGGLGAGFRATDTPSNAFLVFDGFAILDVTAENQKTLVAQAGTVEDLCVTLAP